MAPAPLPRMVYGPQVNNQPYAVPANMENSKACRIMRPMSAICGATEAETANLRTDLSAGR